MKLIFLALLLVGCDGSPPTSECVSIDASTCVGTGPSYSKDVVPILNRSCNQPCHYDGTGVWPLTNYDDVHDWASLLYGDMATCAMPPADAGMPLVTITTAERATIMQWIACDAGNN